jgi:vancomycin resistance protein YoaR
MLLGTRARRSIVRLGCVAALLGLGAGPGSADPTLGVSVAGRPVGPSEDPRGLAADLADAALEQPVTLRVMGQPTRRSWRELGAEVDTDRLVGWIEAARTPDSPMAEHAKDEGAGELALRLPLRLNAEKAAEVLGTIAARVDRPARDARVNTDDGTVSPDQEGRKLDVWATLDALDAALRTGGEEVEVAVIRTAAQRTDEELEGARFDTLLGTFQTPYNGLARDRTHNLRVAARKVDGLVLMPGETFDFNDHIGERSLANGFKPATVIAGGELVDGVGGGACQIAGTLHAAVFFAGLEIRERHPHSRPSSYIKLGLDAAVSYPNLSFSFRNDRDFPIYVRLKVRGGWTQVELWGASRTDEVSFMRRIDEVIPFDERETEDSNLPAGVRVLSQRGVPGFVVSRWRLRRDVHTNVTTREMSTDRYPPTQQIWRVGTGGSKPADYEPPTGDEHDEYTADEYTVMTQGPGLEETETIRRAGRTGTSGWTVRAGMPGVEPSE